MAAVKTPCDSAVPPATWQVVQATPGLCSAFTLLTAELLDELARLELLDELLKLELLDELLELLLTTLLEELLELLLTILLEELLLDELELATPQAEVRLTAETVLVTELKLMS